MLNYIAKNYTKAIGPDDIAREIGLTKSYICRLFRQHTGSTIIGYVNRLRCYQAIYLMESGASVTEAALSVGFNDYNYFSRVFKKGDRLPSLRLHDQNQRGHQVLVADVHAEEGQQALAAVIFHAAALGELPHKNAVGGHAGVLQIREFTGLALGNGAGVAQSAAAGPPQ